MIQEIVFIGVAVFTFLGALIAVWHKNIFYNALGLILALAGIAALFLYLGSEFLAIMQVIIYIGAIAIAIIFAIMLSRPAFRQNEPRSGLKVLRSLAIAALVFFVLRGAVQKTSWTAAGTAGDYSMRALGKNFLTVYALPFEAVSLVILVAILGALLLSSRDEKRAGQ